MRRTRVGEGALWLNDALLRELRSEADRMSPKETGGVLLGYWDDGAADAVVTDWIGPGPGAHHTENGFVPDYAYQEEQIATRYEASGRRLAYLGDWHTHPRGASELSVTDKACLRRIARSKEARARRPLMVVLSDAPTWTLAAWQCERRGWCLIGLWPIRALPVRTGPQSGA